MLDKHIINVDRLPPYSAYQNAYQMRYHPTDASFYLANEKQNAKVQADTP